MTINLPREQQEWLEAQVKAGAYDSVEEAVASIVGRAHASRHRRSFVGASHSSTRHVLRLDRGEGMTLEEYRMHDRRERFGKTRALMARLVVTIQRCATMSPLLSQCSTTTPDADVAMRYRRNLIALYDRLSIFSEERRSPSVAWAVIFASPCCRPYVVVYDHRDDDVQHPARYRRPAERHAPAGARMIDALDHLAIRRVGRRLRDAARAASRRTDDCRPAMSG